MSKTRSSTLGHFATPPALSVVMPVYNALPHLDEAVESILGQTYSDFEFVILDDASTDGSKERLLHWSAIDQRIRLLHSEQKLGPVGSSNLVARAAKAPFVARMDADDISYPQRLSEQLRLLQRDPEVGVAASLFDVIDNAGRKVRDAERWRLSRRSAFVPFAHGAMMYRRKIFDLVGGYRKECEYWEDQDLVVRIAALAKVLVIPRALYRVRQSTTSTRLISDQEPLELALDRAYKATDRLKQRKPYDEVLYASTTKPLKVDPRVFIAIGSVQLWAGGKPHLFWRLLERARLSWNFRTLVALVWTIWASTSPSSLRRFLLLLLNTRNRLAEYPKSTEHPLEWHPFEQTRS